MWEDAVIALICLGFVAALALVVAELRAILGQIGIDSHRGHHPS